MIHAVINGITITAEPGTTILKAAQENGIRIPTLCYLKYLAPEASCRICMVEIEGAPKLVTACSTPLVDGNVIYTDSERCIEARRGVLDLLLSQHNKDCFSCAKDGACEFQNLCFEYGVKETTYPSGRMELPIDDSNAFFTYNPNLCIKCHRCVNTCQHLSCKGAISFTERGFNSIMSVPFGRDWTESECEYCGNCVSVCPVGALLPKYQNNFRVWETKKVRTTCPYCGVGCQFDLVVQDDKVVDIKPADGPVNQGLLCVKGRFAFDFVNNKDRLKTPLIRKDGVLTEATWDEAIELIATKIEEAKAESGPDSIAGFSSARTINEDNYLFQKFLRAAVGTNNVDHCARL